MAISKVLEKNKHFKGKIAEKAFEKEYREYGYEPVKITVFDTERSILILNKDRIEEAINRIFTVPFKEKIAKKVIEDLSDARYFGLLLPDYLCLAPPNNLLIYEIKNNSKKRSLRKSQSGGLEFLRKRGYKVYLKNKFIPLDSKNEFHQEIIKETEKEYLEYRLEKYSKNIKELEELLKKSIEEKDSIVRTLNQSLEYYKNKVEERECQKVNLKNRLFNKIKNIFKK